MKTKIGICVSIFGILSGLVAFALLFSFPGKNLAWQVAFIASNISMLGALVGAILLIGPIHGK